MSDKPQTRRDAIRTMLGAAVGAWAGPSVNKAARPPKAPPMTPEEITQARLGGAIVGVAAVAGTQMALRGKFTGVNDISDAEKDRIWRARMEDERNERERGSREPD
jgi:hypothetical protein